MVEVQRLAKMFNIDMSALPTNVAPIEAAKALSNEMALQLRNPAGGAGMPGAMSDKDREFLTSMVPGIGQTPEGRKLLIDARRKVNERSIVVAKMARVYAQRNGQLDAGFEDELQRYSEANPLFSKDDLNNRERARLPQLPVDKAKADKMFLDLPPGSYFKDPQGNLRQKPMRRTAP